MTIDQYIQHHIRQMGGYVPGEQPQGGKFIKLNTNENPYPPSPKVIAAISDAANRGLQRYPDPIANSFRLRAGEILSVPHDWIICGNGSDDILTILARTFVAPGNSMRYPSPSYTLYSTLAEIQSAKLDIVPFTEDFELSSEFGEASPDVRLVFLPNPNSPTGTVIEKSEIEKLARSIQCPLVVDEAYADFAEFNCIDLVKEHPNLVVTRTLSKSYGLAGLRFGFGIAQPQVIDEMMKVKDSYNCDAISIAAATAAIDDQSWFEENRQKVIETRTKLSKGLSELGFEIIKSSANFVWCNHKNANSQSIYEELKANKILIRYMKYPDWKDGLRISVGTDEQIDALFATLQLILK